MKCWCIPLLQSFSLQNKKIETVHLSLAMEFKRSLNLLAPPQQDDDDIGQMNIEHNTNEEVKVTAVQLEAATYDGFKSAF